MKYEFGNFGEVKEKFSHLKITKKSLFIILGIITAIILGVASYLKLTPINMHSPAFRTLVGVLLLVWSAPLLFHTQIYGTENPRKKSLWIIPLALLIGFFAVNTVMSIATAPIFMAGNYRELISVVDDHKFEVDVEDYSTMQIPVVDMGLAQKLGDKKLGEDNLGSQFSVGKYYMICHNSNLYWIAPIEFNGFFQWVNRKTSPGYIMINANDPADVKIVKTELKYTSSSYFNDDVNRKNYFNNLTAWRAEDAHLELTDEGEPRFVETVYKNTLGYTNGRDIVGIIVTNPYDGKSEYYDYLDAPTWINHVLTEELIVEQLNYWGEYVKGFMNSIFAKSEVLSVSTGVNYVYSNGNMYLQTGMTSVGGDESIVGVMMVDMRTKATYFYRIGGATEYAAAQSAIGKDQEKRYTATDPIMINLDGVPTYFIMLKDDEGLVKRYAYVNVKDYRLVATADLKSEALIEYKKLIGSEDESEKKELEIAEIKQVIIAGDTYYYITFAGEDGKVFRAPVSLNPYLPFLKSGDKVLIRYEESDDVFEITEMEIAS